MYNRLRFKVLVDMQFIFDRVRAATQFEWTFFQSHAFVCSGS